MNRNLLTVLTLIAATAAGRVAAADATNAAPARPAPVKAEANGDAKMDFQSFKLITERNIFDMSRSGIRVRPNGAPIHIPKVDDFILNGTMSYEKGQFAFFDGSSSEYQESRKPGDTIADFKITAIGPDYVDLQGTNSKTIKMPIGMAMRREDKGPWSLTSGNNATVADSGRRSRDRGSRERGSRDRGSRTDQSNADATTTSAPEEKPDSTPASGGSQDEVIKRLMEKRAKLVKDDQ